MGEINLSGSEISVIKALGLSGGSTGGDTLLSRLSSFEEAELLDTLQGLMVVGYVLGTRDNIREVKDMLKATFRVNASYARELEEALDPRLRREKNKPRRRRRE